MGFSVLKSDEWSSNASNGLPIERLLERNIVKPILDAISSHDSTEPDRLQAARDLASVSFDWHCSRLPRGSRDSSASPGVDENCLNRIYRLVQHSADEVRFQLLLAIASIGDEGFVFTADRLVREADDGTFNLIVHAIGQIGGPDSHRWLMRQATLQSPGRQPSIRLALQAIEHGGIADYAEGLVEADSPKVTVRSKSGLFSAVTKTAALFGGAVDKMQTTEYKSLTEVLEAVSPS